MASGDVSCVCYCSVGRRGWTGQAQPVLSSPPCLCLCAWAAHLHVPPLIKNGAWGVWAPVPPAPVVTGVQGDVCGHDTLRTASSSVCPHLGEFVVRDLDVPWRACFPPSFR